MYQPKMIMYIIVIVIMKNNEKKMEIKSFSHD